MILEYRPKATTATTSNKGAKWEQYKKNIKAFHYYICFYFPLFSVNLAEKMSKKKIVSVIIKFFMWSCIVPVHKFIYFQCDVNDFLWSWFLRELIPAWKKVYAEETQRWFLFVTVIRKFYFLFWDIRSKIEQKLIWKTAWIQISDKYSLVMWNPLTVLVWNSIFRAGCAI